jgi:hypothetical protein
VLSCGHRVPVGRLNEIKPLIIALDHGSSSAAMPGNRDTGRLTMNPYIVQLQSPYQYAVAVIADERRLRKQETSIERFMKNIHTDTPTLVKQDNRTFQPRV